MSRGWKRGEAEQVYYRSLEELRANVQALIATKNRYKAIIEARPENDPELPMWKKRLEAMEATCKFAELKYKFMESLSKDF